MDIARVICAIDKTKKKDNRVYCVKFDLSYPRELRDRAALDIVYLSYSCCDEFYHNNPDETRWNVYEVKERGLPIIGIICSKPKREIYCADGSEFYKKEFWSGRGIDIVYLSKKLCIDLFRDNPYLGGWDFDSVLENDFFSDGFGGNGYHCLRRLGLVKQ